MTGRRASSFRRRGRGRSLQDGGEEDGVYGLGDGGGERRSKRTSVKERKSYMEIASSDDQEEEEYEVRFFFSLYEHITFDSPDVLTC